MERIIFLGTGVGTSVNSYNSCFALEDANGDYLLVDSGGGNGILKQLDRVNIDILNIHNIFITHKHIDHILGVIWLYRVITASMRDDKYDGILNIYCNDEVAELISLMIKKLLRENELKYLDKRIFINPVKDRERVKILNYDIEFFDIHSNIDKQFGFRTILNNGRSLCFTGDEPFKEELYNLALNCDYFIHEAFCLEEESMKFKPREKNHDTVAFAALKATKLNVRNLILCHCHDNLGLDRKEEYHKEAKKYYTGNIYIPDDLDIINL